MPNENGLADPVIGRIADAAAAKLHPFRKFGVPMESK